MSYIDLLNYEVDLMKERCDLRIPDNLPYVITLQGTNFTEDISVKLLTSDLQNIPIFIYNLGGMLILCFQSIEGSNCKSVGELMCKYCCLLNAYGFSPLNIKVFYFNNKMEIFSYLVSSLREYVVDKLRSLLEDKESKDLTIDELQRELLDLGIDWLSLSSQDRFGTFYRFKKKDGERVVATFSKNLEFDKYSTLVKFIFD